MTEPTATRSLHAKIAKVMAAAERIPKNGKAPAAMGGFPFVQVGDVADLVRKGLAAEHVTMLPSAIELLSQSEHPTKSGGVMTTESYRVTWTFSDGDTGETFNVQSVGTGADTGDKASPKAQTNALKYGLLLSFLLSTGDDPELSDSSDRRARPQRDAIADAAVARQGIVSGPTGWNPASATYDSGLIGHAEQGKGDADFELRATSDGSHVLSFRLTEGRKGLKATATGSLAELIAANRAAIEGQRVTAWGSVDDRTFTPRPKDGETPRPVTYQVLTLTRLKVGDLDLSEPDEGPTEEEREEMADLAFPVTA